MVTGSSEFVVYPNPTSGWVTVTRPPLEGASAKADGGGLEVYNLLGEIILKTDLKEGKNEIDLSEQANGIYFMRIGSGTQKIIKQ